jgi:hypothetical protein
VDRGQCRAVTSRGLHATREQVGGHSAAIQLGSFAQHMKNLNCPNCKAPFPRWRLVFRFRHWACPICELKIGCSVQSAQRTGAIGGLLLIMILIPAVFVFDIEVWSWGFWGLFLPFSYFLGCIIMLTVVELVPYEKVSRNKWDPVPNLSGIYRKFFLLQFTVIPICSVMLFFAWSLPLWLVLGLTFIIIFVGFLGLIGMLNLLFGGKGIFRRQKSDDAS